jgi:hypothetical protein
MQRIILTIVLIISWSTLRAQKDGEIIVYSASGKVELKSGNVKKQVKSYDVLTSNSVLIFAEKSKLFFIGSDKKMHNYSKPGVISVSKIISSNSTKTSGELGNAMSLIIHHFIEKGKSYHNKTNFSSAGVVTRGGESQLMLFPGYNTLILNELSIRPIFNSTKIDSSTLLKVELLVNNAIKQSYQIKKGESFVLPDGLNNKDEIYLQTTYKGSIEKARLIVASQQKKNAIAKDMAELEASFEAGNDLLIAKALYFESKGLFVDALAYYDKLVEQSVNDSGYADQRNAFLNDLITQ